jgi:hypothetical protein
MNSCDILIMATSRWCIFQTYIRNSPSFWSGVIELQREFPEDTASAAYPCWAWVNSQLIGSDYDTYNASTLYPGTFRNFSLPRTRSGLVGAAAASNTSFLTPFERFGYSQQMTSVNAALSFGQAKAGVLPEAYPWDPTKKLIHTMRPRVSQTETHGRAFGIKGTAAQGLSPMNIASVPVDSDYFYSSAGTATDHWLLPTHTMNSAEFGFSQTSNPQLVASVSYATAWTVNSVTMTAYHPGASNQLYIGQPVTFSSTSTLPAEIVSGVVYYVASTTTNNFGICTAPGQPAFKVTSQGLGTVTRTIGLPAAALCTEVDTLMPAKVYDYVSTGTYFYLATAAGVQKVDNSSTASVKIAAVTDTLMLSIVFDGRYVYAAGETRVWRIDTANSDAVTSNTVTGISSPGQIFWSGSYLWVGSRGTSTICLLTRLQYSAAGVIGQSAVTGITSSTVQVSVGSMCTDFNGSVYMLQGGQHGATILTAADQRLYRITESTATTNGVISSIGTTAGVAASFCGGLHYEAGSIITAYAADLLTVRRVNVATFTVTETLCSVLPYSIQISNMYVASRGMIRISRVGAAYMVTVPGNSAAAINVALINHSDFNSVVNYTTQLVNSVVGAITLAGYPTAYSFDGNRILGANTNTYFSEITNVVKSVSAAGTNAMWMLPK